MKLTITLQPTRDGQHISLTIDDESTSEVRHVGYDSLFVRVTEVINNKLRPLVNKVAEEAKLIRARPL